MIGSSFAASAVQFSRLGRLERATPGCARASALVHDRVAGHPQRDVLLLNQIDNLAEQVELADRNPLCAVSLMR